MDWHEYFTYDEATGNLIWKERPLTHFKTPGSHKRWNGMFPGTMAGHSSWDTIRGRHRYKTLRAVVMGVDRQIKNHHIIWEMHYGSIPEGMQIDHVDRNPLNNRLDNLRLATPQQNNANRMGKKGRAYPKGVGLKRPGIYFAHIRHNRILRHLGYFRSVQEAQAAYAKAAKELHGSFVPE